MAKRKAARTTGRKTSTAARRVAAKTVKRPRAAKKTAAGKAARKGAARKGARKPTAAARKAAKSAKPSKKTTSRAAKSARPVRAAKARTTTPARRSAPARAVAKKPAARKAVPARKVPALNRERRTVADEDERDIVPSPPSSLDLDRSASAVRTGRRGLQHRFEEHTETSPAMTGGDVDADWESAYSVGDEAPGGDNPTPDQDIVDDIGRAVGIEYQDNEELKGAGKVEKRDKNRWELDPASSEDWDDR